MRTDQLIKRKDGVIVVSDSSFDGDNWLSGLLSISAFYEMASNKVFFFNFCYRGGLS